jgi:hypothetical protein
MQKKCIKHHFSSDVSQMHLLGPEFIIRKQRKICYRKQFTGDITYTHLPKMDFIEYLCSFGGLIGMWFGLNVFQFTNDFISLLIKRFKLLLISHILKSYYLFAINLSKNYQKYNFIKWLKFLH